MRIVNKNRKHMVATLGLGAAAAALTLLFSAPAQAGRGGSPAKIASAIRSGSTDAIAAELERAEHLVCAACADHVRPLVDHPEYKVREVAAWWLLRRGTGKQVFTEMLGRLGQPDSVKARNAADVLGQFRSPSAIPALGAALSNPAYNAEAKVAMARALGTIGRAEGKSALVTGLGDADAPVRAASLAALRQLGGARDATPALPLLGDSDAAVRSQAIFLVAEFKAQGAAPALVTIVESDQSPTVRKRAAWALGELRAPYSVAGAALIRAAGSDSSPLVRSLAQSAAGKLSH
jgi:HEAT repeat protein